MANLGRRVRALRRQNQLSQVQLAERLRISPSYLNLIEHDQRPLTAALLLKLAQQFKVDVASFAEDDEGRLAADLREIFSDPLFQEHDVTTADVKDLASHGPAARAILTLYHAYQNSRESAQALAAQVSDRSQLPGMDLAGLPSEEVSDVIQNNMNHFPELEDAAEALTREAGLESDDLYRGMVRYLEKAHGIEVVVANVESDPSAFRRYDPVRKRLVLSEVLPPRSRNFNIAQQIALLTLQPQFQRIIDASHLTTPDSVSLCRVALSGYFAGALLMPYRPFLAAAEAMRYDIELLGHRFRTSFEQVCHRLTTLQRPGATGVPFHFERVDIAGNMSKRFSASGIHFARFSGSCPRWNVHKAFMSPGSIRTQVSQMPDGTRYFCIARTIRTRRGGYGSPHTLLAVGMGCEIRYARKLVYAEGVELDNPASTVPIGITCRLCERMDCEQRAFPPIQHRLSIDENVRSVSFYAPATAARA
jgi:predicted transcriptional regulator/transcriptional regulator with XRE-family HTH domain